MLNHTHRIGRFTGPKVILSQHSDTEVFHRHTGEFKQEHRGRRVDRDEHWSLQRLAELCRNGVDTAVYTTFGKSKEVCGSCKRYMAEKGCFEWWTCCGEKGRHHPGCTSYLRCIDCGQHALLSPGCFEYCSACKRRPYEPSAGCDHSHWIKAKEAETQAVKEAVVLVMAAEDVAMGVYD